MPAANVQDVAVAVGRPIALADQIAQVNYWLAGVEILIRAELGDLTALDQQTLRYVETEAVAAKFARGITAESSITVAVDDGSVTRRYENTVTAADIRDEWWDLLAGQRSTYGHAMNGWLA